MHIYKIDLPHVDVSWIRYYGFSADCEEGLKCDDG